MSDYFHNLFVSQKYLANIPEPDPDTYPDVPGDDPGGGGPVYPPTAPLPVGSYIAYANPRYRINTVINEEMAVIDCINEVINVTSRMFLSQGYNGKIRVHNKKPVTWGLATAATSIAATSIPLDDVRNWITDRSGYLLIDPYTTASEVRTATDANYSTAQNSITLTATANMTVTGFSGCDGNNTPATATVKVDSIASGTLSTVTLDGIDIDFTAASGELVDNLATFIAAAINQIPQLRRRFVATSLTDTVTIKGTFGTLVVPALSMAHAAPLADPVAAPTVVAAAGTTNSLAGDYRINYSYVNARGQTLLSPTTTVTVTAGQQFDVTGVALPTGATGVNWYIETAPASERTRLAVTRTDGSNFSITAIPLKTSTLPPEINRTGAEVMRIRMAFTDRAESRTERTLSNVLRATYEWLLGTRKKSVNSIVLKYRDSSQDWQPVDLHFVDQANIDKVKKEEKEEVNGQGIHTTFQALRIGSSKLGEFRDANFYYNWSSAAREAGLLEEGDVVAITDLGSGVVNLPVMIESIDFDLSSAGLPKVAFTGQKFSNFLYDDSIADRVVSTVTEFA